MEPTNVAIFVVVFILIVARVAAWWRARNQQNSDEVKYPTKPCEPGSEAISPYEAIINEIRAYRAQQRDQENYRDRGEILSHLVAP